MTRIEEKLKEWADQEEPRTENGILVPNGALHTELLKQGRLYQDINFELSRELASAENCETSQCYYNCQHIVLDLKPYRYCDGFVFNEKFAIPIKHAWLLDAEGHVVDPTLALQEDFGSGDLVREYFGVEIERERLREIVLFSKHWDWTLNEALFPKWFERQKKIVEKHGCNVVVIGEI